MNIHLFFQLFGYHTFGIIATVMFVASPVYTQSTDDVEVGRFRFATMYLGVDAQWLPAGGKTFTAMGAGRAPGEFDLSGRVVPRLTFGGLHFWGHADFYVTIPIPPTALSSDENGLTTWMSNGIETGARVYPWKVRQGTLRPFIGAAWSVTSYRQQESGHDAGPTVFDHRFPLQAGLMWLIGPGMFEAGARWMPNTDRNYPASRSETYTLHRPNTSAWLGFMYPFDVTIGLEGAVKHGLIDEIEHEMDSAGELNALTIAAGISTAFTPSRSSYTRQQRPWLEDNIPSGIIPDLGIGYYMHNLDAAVNLSFRPISQSQSAYGFEQDLHRTSLAIEAFKFLADYHGFVPYVGITFGREWLRITERDTGLPVTNVTKNTWAPGIIAGWDIRPTRVESFILRTNLRYTPDLHIDMPSGGRVAFDQFEFNFIQLVVFLERMF